MIIEKLRAMKEASKLTSQQISDLSGIPLATVSRILSGQTENPTFQNVVDLVRAMGGSVDDLAGIENKKAAIPQNDELIKLYREMIADKDKQIATKNKWMTIFAIVAFSVMAFILLLLIYDLLHENIGFIRQ